MDIDLEFKDFENLNVSTKTIIVSSNLVVDVEAVVAALPITNYTIIPKRRGRKKKNEKVIVPEIIGDGSIVTIKHKGEIRGVNLKPPPKKKPKTTKFKNGATIVMQIEGKFVNFKLSRNGTFQFTGCKYNDQAIQAIMFLWSYIKDFTEIYTLESDDLEIILMPAMRNVDFNLGFLIDREKLANYINTHTEYHAMLELLFGYTGVNIKFRMDKDLRSINLTKVVFTKDGKFKYSKVPCEEYLSKLDPKDRKKKLAQERHNTFLVFQSGKCIMSGKKSEFMEDDYYKFLSIINDCKEQIKEVIESSSEESLCKEDIKDVIEPSDCGVFYGREKKLSLNHDAQLTREIEIID